MGMFHEAFRDSSRQRAEPAPELSDLMVAAINEFANSNGVSEFHPVMLGYVMLDQNEVVKFFDENFDAQWSCAEYVSLANRNGDIRYCDTGFVTEGMSILAVQFWVRGSTDPDLNCNEVFIVKAHVRADDEKRGTNSASHATHEVLWWYSPEGE